MPLEQSPDKLLPFQEARTAGHKYYKNAKPHTKCGTNKRNVKYRKCVKCASLARTAKTSERRTLQRKEDPIAVLLQNAKWRAKKRGVEFNLTREDISISDDCPCCKKPFILGAPTGRPVPGTPSLDRLDSKVGYVRDNVAVICWFCNKLKNDGSADEHRRIAEWMDECLKPFTQKTETNASDLSLTMSQ